MFADRIDAGRSLAAQLGTMGPWLDAVVLGIPRGGMVVAAQVARVLGLRLDVVVAAKVCSPGSPEFAIGAVAADGEVLVNADSGFSAEEVRAFAGPAHAKATRSLAVFRAGSAPLELTRGAAIVVDDGLATGFTALAAVEYIRRCGATLVFLAVPVAAQGAAALIEPHVDQLVALEIPVQFASVGQFYARFGQTEDAEVVALLAEAANRPAGGATSL
ncbi:MAG: phosphoribosyltransferase family protein [Coriobacteriia bacterium]